MQEDTVADRTAVIVVDMLNDFVSGPLKCERAPRIIPHLQDLLKAAREKGVYVIYVCDAHLKGIDHELELWGDHALAGTEGAGIIPELEPTDEDFIIRKRRYSGFCGTGLDILLRELHVGTVIITGMQAHICVQHTVADAFYLGYRITVPTDGIEAFTGEILEREYGYLKEMYGAELATVDEITARM